MFLEECVKQIEDQMKVYVHTELFAKVREMTNDQHIFFITGKIAIDGWMRTRSLFPKALIEGPPRRLELS